MWRKAPTSIFQMNSSSTSLEASPPWMNNARYSHPTLVCLAYELVANRAATIQQFKRLRERNNDAIGFCLGMFCQIEDAQERALDMLDFNLEYSGS